MSYTDLRLGRHTQRGCEYLVTTVTARREPLFREFRVARLFVQALRATEHELDVAWLAWVVMPDHFHGLLCLRGDADLARVMRVLKGRSAWLLNQRFARTGRLWQPAYHDHALRAEESRETIAWYIINNPVRAGLVACALDYPHWDCVWLTPGQLPDGLQAGL